MPVPETADTPVPNASRPPQGIPRRAPAGGHLLLLRVIQFLGLLSVLLPSSLLAADAPTPPSVLPLTTIRAVRELPFAEASRQLPVRLEGVVTYFEARWNTLFIQDATGGIYIRSSDRPRPAFVPGQRVEVRGRTVGVAPANDIGEESIRVLGTAPLPDPVVITSESFTSGRHDAQWVEIEAVVRGWSIQFQRLEVELASGNLRFIAHSPAPANGPPRSDFVHSRVRVRGVAGSKIDGAGRTVGVMLYVPELDHYRVVVPSPANPFALQQRSIASLVSRNEGSTDERVHVSGVVTLATGGEAVIAEGASALRLRFHERRKPDDPEAVMDTPPPPPGLRPGDVVEAAGYFESGDGSGASLADAWVFQTGLTRPIEPLATAPARLAAGGSPLRLVQIHGSVVGETFPESMPQTRRHWVLEGQGKIRFEAILPVASAGEGEYAPGDVLMITGVFEPQRRRPDASQAPFVIHARSAADVEVLRAATRWFSRKGAQVLGIVAVVVIALTGLAILLGREGGRQRELNRQLEERINDRTAALTAANERLEHEVTHQRRAERIRQAIYLISEAVHATEDLQSLYRRIHDIIRQLTGAENLYIASYDPAANLLSFPYYVDERDPTPPTRPLGTGFTEHVLRTGRPLLADAATTSELERDQVCSPHGSRAALWLGVPLSTRDRTFGVLAIQEYHNPAAFGLDEKAVLEFVAEQVAIAIDRRRAMDEARESQTRLRESEERFSKGFHGSAGSLSIIAYDDRRYLDVNEGFTRTYGFTREQVINRTSVEIGLWPEEGGRERLEQLLREKGFFRDQETVLRRADGRLITVTLSGDFIEIGGRRYVVISALDITDRKRAETELVNALRREKELSQLKSNFVSLVSHEFRTPLGVILSSAEILERYHERLKPEQRATQLEAIGTSVRRMAHMMNEVLLLGRFDAGRVEFHPARLDLAAFSRRVVDEVSIATGRRCPIELRLPAAPNQNIAADELLLGHMLTNLLSNGVKYSPDGAAVDLEIQHTGDRLTFVVTDRGCGIPEADRDRLFTAFHRGRNVGQVAGTGLGLVIVRRCVDLHGGGISFTSREGEGTTFTAWVPAGR